MQFLILCQQKLVIDLTGHPVEPLPLLTQSPDVSQVGGELLWVALAQHLDRRGALRVADLLVALLQRVRLQALPRQRTCNKIPR